MLIAGNPQNLLPTTQLEKANVNGKNKRMTSREALKRAISSQAASLTQAEGSTTRASARSTQASAKRMASSTGVREDEIVLSAAQVAESQQKRLARKIMYGSPRRTERARSVHHSCLHSTSGVHPHAGSKIGPLTAKSVMQTVLIAGTPQSFLATAQLGRVIANAKNKKIPQRAISSQATRTVEGSTTRATARSAQESAKCTASLITKEDDIVWTMMRVIEIQRNRLDHKKITAICDRRFGWY